MAAMETKTLYYFDWGECIYENADLLSNPFLSNQGFLSTYRVATGDQSSGNSGLITALQSAEVLKMLRDYAYPKVWFVTALISESETLDGNEDYKNWAYRVSSYLVSSYPFFKKLIDLYSEQETKFLAQVATTAHTINKINELPQTEYVGTDDHLTNLNDQQADSASDFGTPMERLDEVRKKLDNTYQRWADEFISKFAIM